jgi:hypothetical protein
VKNQEVALRIGLDAITRQEVLDAIAKHNRLWPRNSSGYVNPDTEYNDVVQYMEESWAEFPPDQHIDDSDPEVWLRRSELDCNVGIYALGRNALELFGKEK